MALLLRCVKDLSREHFTRMWATEIRYRSWELQSAGPPSRKHALDVASKTRKLWLCLGRSWRTMLCGVANIRRTIWHNINSTSAYRREHGFQVAEHTGWDGRSLSQSRLESPSGPLGRPNRWRILPCTDRSGRTGVVPSRGPIAR